MQDRLKAAYRIPVDFVNQATNVTDAEAKKVMAALQVQLDRDFSPIWGVPAQLFYVAKGAKANTAHWWLVLIDNADTAGALGYHDLTDAGLPIGKIFVETTKEDGGLWSVTASHELLEMLADPWINLCVFMQEGFAKSSGATLVAYEVCDAPEDDKFGYVINGVTVSDFVYPAFFEPQAVSGTQLDYQKKLTKPFQLLPGGYIGILKVGSVGGWSQITAEAPKTAKLSSASSAYRQLPRIGSRRERRGRGFDNFIRSNALAKKSPVKKQRGTVLTVDGGVVSGKPDA